MAFVRAMLRAYAKYRLNPDSALASIGLTMAQTRRTDARITAAQMETFSATAMRELDDEALGWFSRKLPWGTYGMLCRASLSAPSLQVAMVRWARHHALLTQDIRLSLHEEPSGIRVQLAENVELGVMREFCLLSMFRYLHGYACWLVDSQLPLLEVRFPFEAPKHARAYRFLFPGPVHFGAPSASLLFDRRSLELVPRRDEAALQAMLPRAVGLTVRQYRRDRMLVERVKRLLADRSMPHITAAQVAMALHISERSLHRHLANERASLQSLKTQANRQRAQGLLLRTDTPVKQVAALVGFKNSKSFARAFRSWFGTSPTTYRRASHPSLNRG